MRTVYNCIMLIINAIKNQLIMFMITKNFCLTFLLFASLLFSTCNCSSNLRNNKKQEVGKDPAEYVNPFIGTKFFGFTYPGASLPFAMIHVSPECNSTGWTYTGGYSWNGTSIMGFSHNREILLQPTVARELQFSPGSLENPDEGYRSRFDHTLESASPGFYSVLLKDYNVNVELTSTKRVAFHRYTFPKTNDAHVIIDIGYRGRPTGQSSQVRIINNTQIEGYKSYGNRAVYFFIEFSKPFLYYGTFEATSRTSGFSGDIYPFKEAETGDKIGAFVDYHTDNKEQILVKVALSYVSVEGARKNLEAELKDWDFDRVKNEAKEIWNNELSRIKIEGATKQQKEIFYTALYHSLIAQDICQDVDGKYFGMDEQVHEAKGYDFYGNFFCWDTYRTEHPLLTIIAPDHVNDIIKSIVAKTKDFGWLPAQHSLNVYGEGMIGDHLVPIVVDAYMKGYRDFDAESIYEAMRIKAFEMPKPPVPKNAKGRSGIDYLKLGYVPVDKATEAVSNTLELAYDDWCIAQFARELGKTSDYELFMGRASNYKNVWDPKTEFMRPRKADGSFLEELNGRKQEIVTGVSTLSASSGFETQNHSYYKYFDPLLVGVRRNRWYSESNAWQYLWAVQHDVQGLINLFGSKQKFNQKLDTTFTMSSDITPPKYIGVVGNIGQYVQGNQPSFHVAYLYDYSGEPWKTQERVRQICEQFYRIGPGGLCGNEDRGSMSAWYVLSSMGIYSVTPGSTAYAIGSPLFGKAIINVGNKKTFTIQANNNSSTTKYIQSGTLNGQPLNKAWLIHEDIVKGGSLIFEMGPKPNKNWGIETPPPSMTR